MKTFRLIFAVLFAAAFCRAGTPILIHNEPVTRDTPNSDDFFVIDGATSGTAKTHANEYVRTNGSYADPSWIPSFAWSKITAPPTTLAGYGITDAQPLSSNLTAFAAKTAPTGAVLGTSDTQTISGKSIDASQLTGSIAAGRYAATTVPVSAVNASGTASSSTFLRGDGAWSTPSGSGDLSSNTTTTVDSEVALFSSTGGKTIKRASGTGVAHLTSGVLSAANVNLASEVAGVLQSANGGAPLAVATFGFDGVGSVVPSSQTAPVVPKPNGFTITGYTIIGDVSGSIVIDVAMATGGSGTFNSITASAKPTLSSQRRVNSTTLTSWTTTVPSGADLKASVVGTPSTLTQCTLVVYGTYN